MASRLSELHIFLISPTPTTKAQNLLNQSSLKCNSLGNKCFRTKRETSSSRKPTFFLSTTAKASHCHFLFQCVASYQNSSCLCVYFENLRLTWRYMFLFKPKDLLDSKGVIFSDYFLFVKGIREQTKGEEKKSCKNCHMASRTKICLKIYF